MEAVLGPFSSTRRTGRRRVLSAFFQAQGDLGFFPDVPALSTEGLCQKEREKTKEVEMGKTEKDRRWTVQLSRAGKKTALRERGVGRDESICPGITGSQLVISGLSPAERCLIH